MLVRRISFVAFLVAGIAGICVAQQLQPQSPGGYLLAPVTPVLIAPIPVPGGLVSNRYALPPFPYPSPYLFPYLPAAQPGSGGQLPHAIPAGRLIVKVEPSDATVFVDGYELAPNSLNEYEIGLLIGRHRLQVRRAEHVDYQNEFDIETNKAVQVTISLTRSR